MTIEEKAKAYDEALKKARKLLNMILDNELLGFPDQIREIFPQLKESENDKNERIQKFIAETVFCQYGDSQEYLDVLAYLEKQQENFKLEDSWHKVTDSFPDSTREVICKDAIGNFFIGRYYKGSNLWEISMYDDMNKSNEDNPPVVMWCDIPFEKQKERKPFKMEVYEVGKGTTICGQDYKCKKDYKVGNCQYIKDATYHCGRDGYLTDQNGVSWSCTPEWFNEYIYTDNELTDKEKNDFVSGQFLQCKLSFDEFKEGEHYWLEYVGDDIYVGRSDNILNKKFHITPIQLYTLFSQQLEEVQGPPQEEKQVSLNYEPSFNENPSDREIIEALIKDLKEQDGFLTAINGVSTKAILSWLKKQKECFADNNKTSTDEDERIRKEINILYSDIDACITELLKARTDKDSESEGKALFKMEGLMVATLQDLSCIEDYLEKQKDASKAIEAVERVDKYIDEHLANAHDMKDSNPDKKYYRGWDDALGAMAGILQDVYSGEKQKEQKPAEKPDLVAELKHHLATTPKEQLQKEWDDLKEWGEIGPTVEEYLYGKPAGWSKEDKDVIDEAAELALAWGCPNLSAKLKSILSHVKPLEWSEDYREEDIQTRFAFYTYKDDSSTLYLSNVFVEEASRNHGFGTRILRAAEKVAETVGATTISLKVKQNSPANAWYRKNGYGYVAFEDGYDWLEKNLEYMKPNKQEWSEEDEKMLDSIIRVVCGVGVQPNGLREKQVSWLKSLRPQSKDEIYKEKDEAFKLGKHQLAIKFMNYLDENRPEGKMSLSNGECEDIDKAFKENNWVKIMRYVEKYSPSWKPSEHQMTILKAVKDYVGKGSGYWGEALGSLIDDLEKLT